jgi:2TM domain
VQNLRTLNIQAGIDMSDDQLNYEEIRRRAEQRANKRKELIMHVAVFIVVNLSLWLVFGVISGFAANPTFLLIPLLSTLGWGMGVAIHGVVNYVETTGMDNMREREIEREIQRELRRRGLTEADLLEKPKRETTVRLSDDGELVYDDDESVREESRQSSRRR